MITVVLLDNQPGHKVGQDGVPRSHELGIHVSGAVSTPASCVVSSSAATAATLHYRLLQLTSLGPRTANDKSE
jgi:hypothetical protein